ncbi:Ubiquitin-like protein-NEDD8-like protein RUB3 [Pseudocercospora fuligena]|uniref:Ubiquitin-like protein-NEDD8-like protein RUB3 n=1 Tax=Pseudocercospora fuligena TaxID=685502 RepID=A0A8H6R6J0_9PEZI|nr:Ubiquitin-like protein-NEDD8-like protein RUB3 [Pseudocercospora fuligena]
METTTANMLNARTFGDFEERMAKRGIIVSRPAVNGLQAQKLEIIFAQTVRVSDNDSVNSLPPGLGSFPICSAKNHRKTGSSIAAPGDFLMPMYQREAMWIKFNSKDKFAVKIYAGGINAVSGEPARETETTMLRRLKLVEKKKSIQDYIVTPDQLWLDGFADSEGSVRQFVAMPLSTGYTAEVQITGEDVIGGMQFEVTPSVQSPLPVLACFDPSGEGEVFAIVVRNFTGEEYTVYVTGLTRIVDLKERLEEATDMRPVDQRLIYGGKQIHDEKTVQYYGIKSGDVLHLCLPMRGGGCSDAMHRHMMGFAAGGQIRQSIKRDNNNPSIWEPESGVIFNVQTVNSEHFREITGEEPPETPVTAKDYAEAGQPYFEIYEEKPSGVGGSFEEVKSVNELDHTGARTSEKVKAIAEVDEMTKNCVVLLDESGQKIGFRTVYDLERKVKERKQDKKIKARAGKSG